MQLLTSRYVIDGVARELTPAQLLGDNDAPVESRPIMDETADPGVGVLDVSSARVEEYLLKVLAAERSFPVPFAGSFTAERMAGTLIDSLLRRGCPRLEDVALTLKWTWNTDRVGNASAFYSSVEAASEYIDGLGVSLKRYSVDDGPLSLKISTPYSGAPLVTCDKFVPDEESWVIYIPFETSDYYLGGSLLSQSLGLAAGSAPQMNDPDYFMDCFELVQELVQDGIALAGAAVGDGGLLCAVKKLCSDTVGAGIDVSDIIRAGERRDVVRVSFAEVPGVVLQIRDSDFDYVDAECLLQDVAFFPMGHPVRGCGDVRLKASSRSGIQNILDSLMLNAEGED